MHNFEYFYTAVFLLLPQKTWQYFFHCSQKFLHRCCFLFSASVSSLHSRTVGGESVSELQLDSNDYVSEQESVLLGIKSGRLSRSGVQLIKPAVYPGMKWLAPPCIIGLYLTLTVCTETRAECLRIIMSARRGSVSRSLILYSVLIIREEERSPDRMDVMLRLRGRRGAL